MTAELSFAARQVLDAAGWALVHSLWQGAVLAGAYACFAALAPKGAAGLRYAGGVLALALLLVLPVATACLTVGSPRGLFAQGEAAP
ncbi:MAG TPA: hypothetical protein VF508_11595, partial [Pyrinomonadaceae bacterium]